MLFSLPHTTRISERGLFLGPQVSLPKSECPFHPTRAATHKKNDLNKLNPIDKISTQSLSFRCPNMPEQVPFTNSPHIHRLSQMNRVRCVPAVRCGLVRCGLVLCGAVRYGAVRHAGALVGWWVGRVGVLACWRGGVLGCW